MTIEEQTKILCKWIVQNSNRPLTGNEKEVIKLAIDQAKTPAELLAIGLAGAIGTQTNN